MLPVAEVQPEDVHSVIRQAFREGLNTAGIDEFLGTIDWTRTSEADPQSAGLLNHLENVTTLYDEGFLTQQEYVRELLRIAPTGGTIGFTWSPLRLDE